MWQANKSKTQELEALSAEHTTKLSDQIERATRAEGKWKGLEKDLKQTRSSIDEQKANAKKVCSRVI